MNSYNEIAEIKRTKDVLIEESINFDSLLLSENTLKGLKSYGFQKPSPIQLKAIPLGRCGFDLIVKSKSGTGKTAVFAIIALEMINLKKNSLQVMIIAPTREIAVQGCEVIEAIGTEYKDLKVSCFIGGLSLEDDIANARKCQIAIGSPGRIKHLMNEGHLKTDHIRLLILDEADKLMESSYQSDINGIYHRIPVRKQMIAVSATYPDELDVFLAKYMMTPTHVSPETDSPLLLGLKQVVCVVKPSLNVMQQMEIKIEEVVKLLSKVSFSQCLVFSNFQTRAESVSNILNRRGWSSRFISGSQTQEERLSAIKDLKEYKCRILLSTDLTSRGIDASNVDLVINYDVPHDASTYLHRMGRAGRYGARGLSVTLAARGKELVQLQNIIGMIGGKELTIAQMPDEYPEGIWDIDLGSFEQIPGKVPDGDVTEKVLKLKNIKSSILELKINRCDGEPSKTDSDEKSIENEESHPTSTDLNNTDAILKMLSEGKTPFVENVTKTGDLNNDFEPTTHSENIHAHDVNITNSGNIEGILKMLSEGRRPENPLNEIDQLEQKTLESVKDLGTTSDSTSILRMLAAEAGGKVKRADLLKQISTNPVEIIRAGAVEQEQKVMTNLQKNLADIDVKKLLTESDEYNPNQSENSNKNEDLSSKRKREDKKSVQQDKRRTSICAKNISLLNVTKLLMDDNLETVHDDVTENINSYLDQIKSNTSENNMDEYFEECEEPHQNVIHESARKLKNPPDQVAGDNMENIFVVAYDSAVNPAKPHWSNFVPHELEVVEEEKVLNLLNCSDENEEEDSEELYHPRNKSRHRKKSWTKRKHTNSSVDNKQDEVDSAPVKNNATDAVQLSNQSDSVHYSNEIQDSYEPSGLYSYHEYGNCSIFNSSFEDCSKILGDNVNEFEDVEGFNAWFLEWQQHVHSVRDYVQQNVYLQEMNNYHYYKMQ